MSGSCSVRFSARARCCSTSLTRHASLLHSARATVACAAVTSRCASLRSLVEAVNKTDPAHLQLLSSPWPLLALVTGFLARRRTATEATLPLQPAGLLALSTSCKRETQTMPMRTSAVYS